MANHVKLCQRGGKVAHQMVEELHSTEEEADTRLFLHARHASQNRHSSVVIQTPDTDVHVLAYHHKEFIPARMYISGGTRLCSNFIDVTAVCDNIGEETCRALPGLHAFTGCDSVSAFVGMGKKKALDLVQKEPELCKVMQDLGRDFNNTEDLNAECEQFVCAMYGNPGNDVNELRYTLFSGRNTQSHQLSPTKDALMKHVQRANYQAAIWKRSLESKPHVPSATTHGWSLQNGSLGIEWMTQQPATVAILEYVSCGCSGTCESKRCSCKKSGLSCTDVCHCGEICTNKLLIQSVSSDESDEE